jgi:hypothetical protein
MDWESMGLIEKYETLLEDDRLSFDEVINILDSEDKEGENA